MNLVDKLMSGKIALDIENSYKKDIKKLSDIVYELNPNLSQRYSPTYYYPTLDGFCNHAENEVCFYNIKLVTWDGYRHFEHSGFKIGDFYTAGQILSDWLVKDINEEDFMKMFGT